MKKLTLTFILSLITFSIISSAYAERVNGYYRKNGTYVDFYSRSDRNSTVTDNYSYKGNYNPYTGSSGSNYYRHNQSSAYYDGY